jgi:lipoyl synthase
VQSTADIFDGPSSLPTKAWDISRSVHGNTLSVYVPGMFIVDGRRGKYRAVSITGNTCTLNCEHCKGTLLTTMAHAPDPEALFAWGLQAHARGDLGILISGGCDSEGRLPWRAFLPVIARLKAKTGLIITAHTGLLDLETARAMKEAGVDQALLDVMGDDETVQRVYHLSRGVRAIRTTLDNLAAVGMRIVPHILFGIFYGREAGETAALSILRGYPLEKYVVVVIMPFRGTPMAAIEPPPPERVATFLAEARIALPTVQASLGCARPRGLYRRKLDVLAVRTGINSLALPAPQALDEAVARGLDVQHRETCCSL